MAAFDGRSYQARFDAMAGQGVDVHGEASLVRSYVPASVLDAGCGTGRVAIELDRHGIEVVGVDVDESMLGEARRLAPHLTWIHGDLADLALERSFDVVVMAGNVPLFCPELARPCLVERCGAHLVDGGRLVSGFSLGRGYGLDAYDLAAASAGLELEARWSTWDRRPFTPGSDYAVSVHRSISSRGSSPAAAT